MDLQTIEAIILSKMLTSVNSANQGFERLKPVDFEIGAHQDIFRSMHKLYKQNFAIESEAVLEILSLEFPKSYDPAYLYGIIHSASYGDDLSYYIEKLKESSRKKSLLQLSSHIQHLAKTEKDFTETYKEIIAYLDDIQNDSDKSRIKDTEVILNEDYRQEGQSYLAYFDEKYNSNQNGLNTISGIPTFFIKMDSMIEGLNAGHFIIVAARPGVGKTSFILQMMAKLIEKQITVGFFSLEMTAIECLNKLVSNMEKIDYKKIDKAYLLPEEYKRVRDKYSYLAKHCNKNLIIDDQESLTIDQICSRAKRMKEVNGIQALFVDYLTLIRGGHKFINRQEEIQYISSGLRSLAKKLKIPVVCIAQLNRDSEKQNRIPMKSDLRESGQIEQDAHCIIMLHKPGATNSPDDQKKMIEPGKMSAYIVKNRFGQEGVVHFACDMATSTFEEFCYEREIREAFENEEARNNRWS